MPLEDIRNIVRVDEQIVTAGQPTEEQFKAVAEAGITTVINLAVATSQNALPNEAEIVQALGMTYHHLPVIWDHPTPEDFAKFEATLAAAGTEKTLIHCALNFRVTAFYSLYAQKHLGWTEAQADQFRAQVWTGSDYPIWEQFIQEMKGKISSE
jgi:uncharacterized protein (TIGR01244 family)